MYTVQGTDVSRWNDNISTPQHVDFSRMRAAGAQFVFIKVSQATYLDRDYTINWNNARLAGIARGGYHYLDWSRPVLLQAQFFAGALQQDPGELPPVVDYEERYNIPVNAAAQLEIFCDEFAQKSGRRPMIYTSPGMWRSYGNNKLTWKDYRLWVAHYTTAAEPMLPAPWQEWTFWQYTSQGNGPYWGGDAEHMDLNWYSGTLAEFRAEFGLGEPPLTLEQRVSRLEQMAHTHGVG